MFSTAAYEYQKEREYLLSTDRLDYEADITEKIGCTVAKAFPATPDKLFTTIPAGLVPEVLKSDEARAAYDDFIMAIEDLHIKRFFSETTDAICDDLAEDYNPY